MYLTTNVTPTAVQAAIFYTLLEKSEYSLVASRPVPIKRVWSWKYWTFMDKYPEIRDIPVLRLIDAERRFHHFVDENRELLFSPEFLTALGHRPK